MQGLGKSLTKFSPYSYLIQGLSKHAHEDDTLEIIGEAYASRSTFKAAIQLSKILLQK